MEQLILYQKSNKRNEFERKRLKTGRLDDQQPKLRRDNCSSGVQRIHTTINLNLQCWRVQKKKKK